MVEILETKMIYKSHAVLFRAVFVTGLIYEKEYIIARDILQAVRFASRRQVDVVVPPTEITKICVSVCKVDDTPAFDAMRE